MKLQFPIHDAHDANILYKCGVRHVLLKYEDYATYFLRKLRDQFDSVACYSDVRPEYPAERYAKWLGENAQYFDVVYQAEHRGSIKKNLAALAECEKVCGKIVPVLTGKWLDNYMFGKFKDRINLAFGYNSGIHASANISYMKSIVRRNLHTFHSTFGFFREMPLETHTATSWYYARKFKRYTAYWAGGTHHVDLRDDPTMRQIRHASSMYGEFNKACQIDFDRVSPYDYAVLPIAHFYMPVLSDMGKEIYNANFKPR